MENGPENELPWFMRLTLINTQTGQTTFAMYPEDKYSILESLDCCQIPYGSGEYAHLAVSANGVPADSLQVALAGVIESKERPPSIRELNYLGGQIQRMAPAHRARLEQRLLECPGATITDAINASHSLMREQELYDGASMADRAVLLSEREPFLRVQLVLDDGEEHESVEDGVWVDCPASEEELEAAAQKLGADSYKDLCPNMLDGLLATSDVPLLEYHSPFVSIGDINALANAMKQCGIQQMGKLKAVLQSESCLDFYEAAEVAGRLDDFEYYPQGEFQRRCQAANPGVDCEALAEDLGFEETAYGLVREADDLKLEQQLQM